MEKIKFDSSDWDSIRKVYEILIRRGTIQCGETAEGEFITFDCNEYEETLMTEVLQHNQWTRKNVYHLDTKEIETLYSKTY